MKASVAGEECPVEKDMSRKFIVIHFGKLTEPPLLSFRSASQTSTANL